MKKSKTGSAVILLCLVTFSFGWAAKAPSSPEQLEKTATHIVVGKVQAVYSYKEREGIPVLSGYEYDHKVAEVKIEKVEKGKIAESLVSSATGVATGRIGAPAPGRTIVRKPTEKGEICRFYLAKNAYDGWSKGSQDGGYNVVYVNGIQPVKK